MSQSFKLTVKFDNPSFVASLRNAFQVRVGYQHGREGYHPDHKSVAVGSPFNIPETFVDDSMDMLFTANPTNELKYWVAHKIPGPNPTISALQPINFGEAYILQNGVATVKAVDWVKDSRRFGFMSDVYANPLLFTSQDDTPPVSSNPAAASSWNAKNRLFVPGSGYIRIPRQKNLITVWLETKDSSDVPEELDNFGDADQSIEYPVTFTKDANDQNVAKVTYTNAGTWTSA